MHYEGRRVAVSIDAHEQALSLVDQPKGMMKRVFHRRPNRAIELDRITRLGLFGGTQLEVRTAAETLVLECGCAGDGARWLGLLRARCGQAAQIASWTRPNAPPISAPLLRMNCSSGLPETTSR